MTSEADSARKPVAVIIGGTSKWQADGRNTHLIHGSDVDDLEVEVSARWGVGGALAQKFAGEGYLVVVTTRREANAVELAEVIMEAGGESMIVELDLTCQESIATAFSFIREKAGDPDVLIYNAGYLEGRDLPPGRELLEYVTLDIFETANHIACRGPFLIAKEVLPGMREKGAGSFFFTNNAFSLRGRKRKAGESLYYPRVLMRALSQVLTEEYSEHGVHVANVVIDGLIDSPGTRLLPEAIANPSILMSPARIADTYYYLHCQDHSCWTHEIQLTPSACKPSY